MVDTAGRVARIGTPAFSAAIEPVRQGLPAYAAFAVGAVTAPPQSPTWIDAWTRAPGIDAVIASVALNGRPILMAALEIRPRGPFKVGEFVGGSHANGNFIICSADFTKAEATEALAALSGAVRQTRPDIDLLLLERQAPMLDGIENPLAGAPLQCASPNVALAVSLCGGFEAVLERNSRKRKLKKYRSQLRKFEAAGGFRRLEAASEAEVTALLSAFFAMKSRRFHQLGIADVFEPEPVRDAFTRLYLDALSQPGKPFVLHGLEVGGTLRAVAGSSRMRDRIICDFIAFSDDELAGASPGDFLHFENIKAACEEGYAVFDFSVGDEPYKRQWCDIETQQFDVFLPITVKGRALAIAEIGMAGAKRRLKENQMLWSLAKRVRAMRGKGRDQEEGSSDGD